MTISRYTRTNLIKGGLQYGTSVSANAIYRAVQAGAVTIERKVLHSNQRLDQIAGKVYGDGRLWWVIAAASGIGWAPQCPENTVLYIPTDLSQIANLVG